MLYGDILGERARLTPSDIAVICHPGEQRFTYAELNNRAVRCARLLLDRLHLSKGDRIGILARNRVEFLDVFFAAGKSGIISVPLNTRHTLSELIAVASDSGMRVLFYDGEFAEQIRELKRATSIEFLIALDPIDRTELDYADSVTSLDATNWVAPAHHSEDLHCLLYTSGTTGKAKGVMIPHRMVAWNGYNTAICWQLRKEDVSPVFTPLYHAGGLFAFLIPIFIAGGTIVLHREFDVREIWNSIEQHKCTVVLGVPTIFKMLIEASEAATADLRHVRWFISGGAPLPVDLIDAYHRRGVILKQGYGLTEVGVNCFSMTPEEALQKRGSIGKPMMFTEGRLLGANNEDVVSGDTGELCLRGPHVCKGYWNNPQATADAIDRDGWFHTGDLARCDQDGFFYIVGRAKDMFISGGVNVYPAEIESLLLTCPGVRDAAVIGIPDPKWGEVGVAFVVRVSDQDLSAEKLKVFLAGKIAKYKIPRDFCFLDSLPRTPYGKVLKSELRSRIEQRDGSINGVSRTS